MFECVCICYVCVYIVRIHTCILAVYLSTLVISFNIDHHYKIYKYPTINTENANDRRISLTDFCLIAIQIAAFYSFRDLDVTQLREKNFADEADRDFNRLHI